MLQGYAALQTPTIRTLRSKPYFVAEFVGNPRPVQFQNAVDEIVGQFGVRLYFRSET